MAQTVKNLRAMQETQVQSLGQPDPWRREWQPTPVFLPGEFYGQRSLAGYNLLSCKELDMTEQIKHTQGQFYIKKKSTVWLPLKKQNIWQHPMSISLLEVSGG